MKAILETSISKYIISELIGHGGTCTVYKGYSFSDDSKNTVAIKIFEERDKKYFDKEILIHNYLHSEDFLQIYTCGDGYIHIENNCPEKEIENENEKNISPKTIYSLEKYNKKKIYYIIEELAENGELFDYIYELKEGFSEKISAKIFSKILSKLKILHDNRIVHCDIKPENIIVGNDFNIKLIDFGFCEILGKEDNYIYDYKGSEVYSAPEVRNRNNNIYGYDGIKSDIFSLGVLLFVITVGRFPFESCNYSDRKYRLIMNKKYEDYWCYFQKYNLSKEFKELIEHLICYDPSERFSIDEIFQHSFIKNNINENNNNCSKNDNNNDNDIEVVEELMKRKEIIDAKKSL